jgi:hypothetical protein
MIIQLDGIMWQYATVYNVDTITILLCLLRMIIIPDACGILQCYVEGLL